jgi:hypothetical protein
MTERRAQAWNAAAIAVFCALAAVFVVVYNVHLASTPMLPPAPLRAPDAAEVAAAITSVQALVAEWRQHRRQQPSPAGARRRSIVLVRSVSPTRHKVERITKWAQEFPTGTVHVSFDVTVTAKYHAMHAPTLRAHNVTVFTYRESDLETAFPALATNVTDPLRAWRHTRPRHWKSLAWGFHVEAVAWWLQEGAGIALARPPRAHSNTTTTNETDDDDETAIWVLEDDVGVTGSLAQLLSFYDSPAHARCHLVTGPPTPVAPDYHWAAAVTPAFAALVPPARRVFSSEHVQRFTLRYLRLLGRLAQAGCTAWSEMAAASVGVAVDGEASVCALDARHVRAGQYGVRHRVDRLTFERAVKAELKAAASNGSGSGEPQLWHRLMW